jgi:CBS domain-containing protein
MLVKDCMTKNVQVANPSMSLKEAARKMRDGDFGALPVGENDRLVGMVTDRDIVTRALADGKDNPLDTKVREVMSENVYYCFEDQDVEHVAKNLGLNQIRRLPVLNREKRLVGIISLGDLALSNTEKVDEALCDISRHEHKDASVHYQL